MKSFAYFLGVFLLVVNVASAKGVASRGTLLQFDFDGESPWAQQSTPGAGTVDVAGGKAGSGAVVLVAEEAQTHGDWRAQLTSGPLAVHNAESNVAKLTLSFALSASSNRPVAVRVESFDAQKKSTGAIEALAYPAAPDFFQRFALDLSTFRPTKAGKFDPAAPFVGFTFEISHATGWPDAVRQEVRVDNVNYAKPAFYVRADGDNARDGLTESTAFATPQKALDLAGPGDMIVVGTGTYSANGEQEGVAKFVRPGTPAAWIVLKNYPGEQPTFSSVGTWATVKIGNSGTTPGANTTDAPALAYLEVRGIHVRGDADLRREEYKTLIGKKDVRNNSNGISVEGRGQKNKPHYLRFADNVVEAAERGRVSVRTGRREPCSLRPGCAIISPNGQRPTFRTVGLDAKSVYVAAPEPTPVR